MSRYAHYTLHDLGNGDQSHVQLAVAADFQPLSIGIVRNMLIVFGIHTTNINQPVKLMEWELLYGDVQVHSAPFNVFYTHDTYRIVYAVLEDPYENLQPATINEQLFQLVDEDETIPNPPVGVPPLAAVAPTMG